MISIEISTETYLFLLITQQGNPEAVNLYNDILSSFYKNGTQQIKSAILRSSLFKGLILSFKSKIKQRELFSLLKQHKHLLTSNESLEV